MQYNTNLKYRQYFQNEHNYQNLHSEQQKHSSRNEQIMPQYNQNTNQPFNYQPHYPNPAMNVFQHNNQNQTHYQTNPMYTLQQPLKNTPTYMQQTFQRPINTFNQKNEFQSNYVPTKMTIPMQTQKVDYMGVQKTNNFNDPTQSMIDQAHESLRLLKSKRPNSRQFQDQVNEENYFQQKEQNFPMKPKQVAKQGKVNTAPINAQRKNRPPQQNKFDENLDDRPAQAKLTDFKQQLQVAAKNQDMEFEDLELFECNQGCGRQFTQDKLPKHESICIKVFQQKRKKFDTAKQRIVSQDQPSLQKQGSIQTKKQETLNQKKPSWKSKSQAFRAILKQNTGTPQSAQVIIKFKEAYEMKQAMEEAQGLQPCEFCGRKFNQKAHERHVPFCKEKTQKDQFKQKPLQKRK